MTQEQLDSANALMTQIDSLNIIKAYLIGQGTNDCIIQYSFPQIVFNAESLTSLGVSITIPTLDEVVSQISSFCDNKITDLQRQLAAI